MLRPEPAVSKIRSLDIAGPTQAKKTNASAPVSLLTTSPLDISRNTTKTVPIIVRMSVTTKTAELLSAMTAAARDVGYAWFCQNYGGVSMRRSIMMTALQSGAHLGGEASSEDIDLEIPVSIAEAVTVPELW